MNYCAVEGSWLGGWVDEDCVDGGVQIDLVSVGVWWVIGRKGGGCMMYELSLL